MGNLSWLGIISAAMKLPTWELITQVAIVVTGIATASTGFVAIRKWMSETAPKDKLVFSGILVQQLTENNKLVPRIQIGFALRNLATFSIEFEIKEMRTELENLHPYPPLTLQEKRRFQVFPGNTFSVRDNAIDLSNSLRQNQTLKGRMHVKLKYGYPGKLTQDLEIENAVLATFDANGDLVSSDFSEIL